METYHVHGNTHAPIQPLPPYWERYGVVHSDTWNIAPICSIIRSRDPKVDVVVRVNALRPVSRLVEGYYVGEHTESIELVIRIG